MPHNEAAKTNPSAPRKTARDTHLFKLDASFQTSFRVTVSIMTFRTENSIRGSGRERTPSGGHSC